jgi:hypothetical protein
MKNSAVHDGSVVVRAFIACSNRTTKIPARRLRKSSVDDSLFVRYDLVMPDDPKQLGALLIAASLVAAIRLRGEPVKPSPRLTAVITDSVQLCVLVWREVQGRKSALN